MPLSLLSSGLLNLSSLLGGLAELAPVKKHLLRASREILMAVQGLLNFADQHVSSSDEKDQQQTIHQAISFAQKTLRHLARQLPKGDEEEYRTLHRKVMMSILDVLDTEIQKNERSKNQKTKMKAEVFQAIRKVLLRQMYEQEIEHDKETV